MQKINAQEINALKNNFSEEKVRMMNEINSRDEYIRELEKKIEQMENEIVDYKTKAAELLNNQLKSQEDKFSKVISDSHKKTIEIEDKYIRELNEVKNIYVNRIKELENNISELEKRIIEKDKIIAFKKEEFINIENTLNKKMSELEEERKNIITEYEERKRSLEREYARKEADIERLRIELTKAIAKYKNKQE